MNVIAVNLTGAFLCAQSPAARMVSQGTGGSIVNVTSFLDREVLEGGAAYCASKGALRQLTRVMALELARHHIRVNGVADLTDEGRGGRAHDWRDPASV
jgi:NAD(P)-dependent dehydrogenase (short-subunit alcohol dehydrogenase family)